jgi:hypothetical protein
MTGVTYHGGWKSGAVSGCKESAVEEDIGVAIVIELQGEVMVDSYLM